MPKFLFEITFSVLSFSMCFHTPFWFGFPFKFMGFHLPHFGRSWPCFQCHVSKSLIHSLFTLIYVQYLSFTVHCHQCYDELLRECRTCRNVSLADVMMFFYVCVGPCVYIYISINMVCTFCRRGSADLLPSISTCQRSLRTVAAPCRSTATSRESRW